MVLVTSRVSDLTREPVAEGSYVRVVVQQHPKLTNGAVQFDASQGELADLKAADDLVVLKLHPKSGDAETIVTTLLEFNKLADDMDSVLSGAEGVRGRKAASPL